MSSFAVWSLTALSVLSTSAILNAQVDPGVRPNPPGAGTPIAGMTAGEQDFFNNHGVPQFTQVEGVGHVSI
jgi:hypothetical protein